MIFLCRYVAVAVLLAAAFSSAADADRYWVQRISGEKTTGDDIRSFDAERGPRLGGKWFFEGDDPARIFRDTELSPAELGAHIELTNGDKLAGRAIGVKFGGDSAEATVDHLLVSHTRHTLQVRVRLDWVRRISIKPRPHRSYSPGFVETTDSRQFTARSVRWATDGVKALTDEGIVTIPYDRIADLHATTADAWLAPLPGAALLDIDGPPVLRLLTGDGEVFTVPRTMLTAMDSTQFERRGFFAVRRRKPIRFRTPQLATRPPWSLDTLLVDQRNIAFATWLAADELPLSLLRVAAVEERAGVHHLPWQLQRGVVGKMLASDEAITELGVGMHSFTRLTFDLPAHAKTFTTQVGFDTAARGGGCVHVRVWRDTPSGTPLWQREFFRGSDSVQQVGPLDIAGAKQLILEVDFADRDRPQGADPLDIRDWINWLMPIVTVDREQATPTPAQLAQLIPEIENFRLAPEHIQDVRLRPYWFHRGDHWAMAIDSNKSLTFTREVTPSLNSAWFTLWATRDDSNAPATVLHVRAAGEELDATNNSDLATHNRNRFTRRHYVLPTSGTGPVQLEIVTSADKDDSEKIRGLVFGGMSFEPFIADLPADGQPITPDVPLTTLKVAKVENEGDAFELAAGKLTTGEPLNVRGFEFADGYGVPAGSSLTYTLDPAWRAFVAIIGQASGWQGPGPFQILLDDKPHWTSEQSFTREDRAQQVSVPLPPGHTTITLKLLGEDSQGAWASAGFLTDAE